MRAQRLGWDEGTSGESVWGTRGWGGMRVQVERVYGGPEVGVGWRYKWRVYEGPEVAVG